MHMTTLPTRRILLISQEKAVQEITQICLETVANCEVLTADSGNEGIAKAETQQVNAILLDLDEMTVDPDWRAIVQTLQNNPATRRIPVILLTTTEHSKDLPQFNQTGVRAAIAKSFDLLTLASQVAAALEWN
ncbi:response regulator containing a CheY-like receiver domain and an HD-GYP domain [Pleurocapsa sp. PCC 7327]|uniref:response regulator n=1 Tax=Pleurocapsa sp. PCC 7327 TaxID=118163 RepID=UPI00029F83D7|nr:response regulator containing a CheY-like receiver domain and an HD-GYP domain [Pleurocapsa sp. PCC 7327]